LTLDAKKGQTLKNYVVTDEWEENIYTGTGKELEDFKKQAPPYRRRKR